MIFINFSVNFAFEDQLFDYRDDCQQVSIFLYYCNSYHFYVLDVWDHKDIWTLYKLNSFLYTG